MKKTVKFGVLADLHSTISPDAAERMSSFLDDCRKEDVDFIIQLGDFVIPEFVRFLRCKDYSDNEKIISMFNNFEKPSFHVIGNHDCQGIDKSEILSYWGQTHAPYYSFDINGFHFAVLDCNFFRWDGKIIPFGRDYIQYRNSFAERGEEPDLPYISEEQLEWLEKDLAKTPYPTILFSHQRLCYDNCEAIRNAYKLEQIINSAPCGVVFSVNGHEHIDNVTKVKNTWYYNMNSMSNYWLGEEFEVPNRYGAQMDEIYPFLKYVAPYDKPVYAIITIDENGAAVKGKKAEFVGPAPEEIGAYEEGSRFLTDLNSKITPSAEDRYMPFK